MHRFWSSVIKPVLAVVGASTLVEIGAGDGRHSRLLARWARTSGATLHVVDPEPGFGLTELSEGFGDCVQAHLRPSLEVLPQLPPADVVLIDGDHNWYTVYHELMVIYGSGAEPPAQAPIAICHDVAWPYGRRDLYYVPGRIPAEYRQPSQVGPLRPDDAGIAPLGINPTWCHAVREGGARNGVRTAIEDALAGREGEFRILWLPMLHGLALIVPRARLARHRGLARLLDTLQPSPPLASLLRLTEHERCMAMVGPIATPARSRRAVTAPDRPVRPFDTVLTDAQILALLSGSLGYRYKGRAMLLNPLDMANYLALLGALRPVTLFEIGTHEGGRALWLADNLAALGVDARIITVDITPPQDRSDPRIEWIAGDARRLGEVLPEARIAGLPHPFLVIEDSAHDQETCAAVLRFFDDHLISGDYLVMEDGIVTLNRGVSRDASGLSPPSRALAEFLTARGGDYEIATEYCDRFGYNATFQPNGWLRRR